MSQHSWWRSHSYIGLLVSKGRFPAYDLYDSYVLRLDDGGIYAWNEQSTWDEAIPHLYVYYASFSPTAVNNGW
jgi:hypothetical protein